MGDVDKNPDGASAEPLFSTLLAESPQLWHVVDEFVRTLPEHIEAMKGALHERSFEQVQILARQLENNGADHGYGTIAKNAQSIEQAAHDHVVDDLANKIADLTALVTRIQAGLDSR